MDTNIVYDFNVDEQILPEYNVTRTILEWLRSNLVNLVDNNNKPLFNKVNLGYNENSLKGLGKKPTANIYLTNVEYKDYITYNIPSTIHTALIVSLKGNANNTYTKALELHDYIVQEFIENKNWRELSNIVKETHLINSEVQINPNNTVWSNLVLFELEQVLI